MSVRHLPGRDHSRGAGPVSRRLYAREHTPSRCPAPHPTRYHGPPCSCSCLPPSWRGRLPRFPSPMSKDKSAEHTPLMKHDGFIGIICKQTLLQQ